MKQIQKILFVIALLLVLPLINAETKTHERNTELDIKVPFEVNGSIASSLSTCNLTLTYPNSTFVRENASMQYRNNGFFNLTI